MGTGLATFVVIATTLTGAVGVTSSAAQPVAASATKDRLPPDAMRAMVAGPLAIVEQGDFAAGAAAFEALLLEIKAEKGDSSVEAADALTSFGVLILEQDRKREAVGYLRRAVDAYRAALPPDSADLALALNDYATVFLQASPGNPPADVETAAREALAIRVRTLGETNLETAGTYMLLGEVLGGSQRARASQVDEAVSLLRRGIAIARKSSPPDTMLAWHGQSRLLRLLARNGRASQAESVLREALVSNGLIYRGAPETMEKMFANGLVEEVAGLLEGAGQREAARRIKAQHLRKIDQQELIDLPARLENQQQH
jgi:tetratricopeptide (TPR) repeat protein